MLLPLVFALSPPAVFVKMIEQNVASAHMQVVDWWADDLDGDHVPESIAFACNDSAGVYLVQHGSQLLQAPAQIDGRNPCPDAGVKPVAWHVEKRGVISSGLNVHHGNIEYSIAIREGRMALVGEDDHGIEVGSTGTESEDDHVDYDALTWSKRVEPPHGRAKASSGPLVVVTHRVQRASKVIGASTIAATQAGDRVTLHIHADRVLVLRDCSDTPCTTKRVEPGDSETPISSAAELEVVTGRTTVHLKLDAISGEQSYPSPPSSL